MDSDGNSQVSASKNVARPSGTTMQLAVNSRKFHRCPCCPCDIKDDKTEENTFEILQHSDRIINNS